MKTVTDREAALDANSVLNGVMPNAMCLHPAALDWAERNLGFHCETVEAMVSKNEVIVAIDMFQSTAANTGEAGLVDIELLALAAGIELQPRGVDGYRNPHHVDTRQKCRLMPRKKLMKSFMLSKSYQFHMKQKNRKPRGRQPALPSPKRRAGGAKSLCAVSTNIYSRE